MPATAQTQKETIEIDAAGQSLGRLAVRVAQLLRGKDKVGFVPNRLANRRVVVFNTKNIKLTRTKATQKIYYHHSGYPGGLSALPLGRLFDRDSREVVRRAVSGMLPKNKLHDPALRNLVLIEGDLKDK